METMAIIHLQAVQSQAIKILGSIDFLGNPVGLLTDVASGVSGMIAAQPDVMGLVRDVAHGMSDTTSKVRAVCVCVCVCVRLSVCCACVHVLYHLNSPVSFLFVVN